MNDPLLSFLGITRKSGNIVFGMDPVKKDLLKEKIRLVLVTNDISKNSLKEIQSALNNKNIKIIQIDNTKDDINSAVGKYSAIIGISNKNFAEKIIALVYKSEKSIRVNDREEYNL